MFGEHAWGYCYTSPTETQTSMVKMVQLLANRGWVCSGVKTIEFGSKTESDSPEDTAKCPPLLLSLTGSRWGLWNLGKVAPSFAFHQAFCKTDWLVRTSAMVESLECYKSRTKLSWAIFSLLNSRLLPSSVYELTSLWSLCKPLGMYRHLAPCDQKVGSR